jgi:hypothetical protein
MAVDIAVGISVSPLLAVGSTWPIQTPIVSMHRVIAALALRDHLFSF